ncbi:MAG: protein translocase subunit SecD, partial [Bacteroidales bacterium]|nr:protein translocase subunit SecD [Bacteroidales bacterium]
PLFAVLSPSVTSDRQIMPGSVVGMSKASDTARVMQYFKLPQAKSLLPRDLKLLWSVKPYEGDASKTYFELHAIKQTGRDGRPPLDGLAVTSARGDYQQNAGSQAEVSMSMNTEGSKIWARMTRDNVGRCIAIVLDNSVYSAPRVNSEITGGNSQITGNFTINEATDLANILKSGKMPAPARIVQDEVVGPSLGQESVSAGLVSFILALFVVLLYLVFYYSSAGIVADIALMVNMLFLMGVMASVGVVLTLPGIAGIVLTIGMADDANVIIFERIREELRAGKALRNAVADGYKHAYSAIIDGQMTTLITGIILFLFGSGPIQGFATTLVLGIFTSLFCSIFITRLIYDWLLDRNKTVKFSIPATENILVKAKYDFIGFRKLLYGASLTVIGIGIISIFAQGFNYGIDFTGGRNYVVNFGKEVSTIDLRSALIQKFPESSVEVKTFGSDQQVKITTDYLIDQSNEEVDNQMETLLYEGSKPFLANSDISFEQFRDNSILSSQKVGPTIADDIKIGAVIAVIVALFFIFIYIFIRFKDWRFGLGAIISLFHDSLILIVLYSLLWKIMPFSLEIDQQFIAAILTVIGYSINDTVIIYDRIREYRTLYPKRPMKELFNSAMNSTLGRTINTSLTTILVLAVIFIWGGEPTRGFAFAMMIGILIGTYSSVFNAAPIVYDLLRIRKDKKA